MSLIVRHTYYTQYEEQNGDSEASPSGTRSPENAGPQAKRARVSSRTSTPLLDVTTAQSSGEGDSATRGSTRCLTTTKTKQNRSRTASTTTTRKTTKAKARPASSKKVSASGAINPRPVIRAKASTAKKAAVRTAKTIQSSSMHWTIELTALAIQARLKQLILAKFAATTSDTKAIRDKWEDTINVFHQCALVERAWGDGEPREVSVKQFKNKLNAIRAAYRLKRAQLLATGNRVHDGRSDSEDDGSSTLRKFPEMHLDYFLEPPDSESDSSGSSNKPVKLTCDPLNVNPTYRNALGTEIAGLWPLLCDVFSHRPGCTGEAITESSTTAGVNLLDSAESEDSSESKNEEGDISGGNCSDTPSEARAKAKAAAKAKKQRDRQRQSSSSKSPVDTVSDTLQAGFESIERVLVARRNPPQSSVDIAHLFGNLTSTLESSHAAQQVTTQALLQGISELHQLTEKLYKAITKEDEHSRVD